MKQFKYYGFFDEFGFVAPDGTVSHLNAGSGAGQVIDTPNVVQYLNDGWICVETFDEEAHDVITGESLGAMRILTDGEWIWPSVVAHYVQKHSIEVPPEFVKRMQENGWHVPMIPREEFEAAVTALVGDAADDSGLLDVLDMLEKEGGAS